MGTYFPSPNAVALPWSQTVTPKGHRQLQLRKAGVCLCSGSRVKAPNIKITPRSELQGIPLEKKIQAMRGHLFCLPLGTCFVSREELWSRQALMATDSAQSRKRRKRPLRSGAWLVTERVSPPSSGYRVCGLHQTGEK